LSAAFGCSFSDKTIRHLIRFAAQLLDREIVSTPSRQLGWTHFRKLI